VNIHLVFIHIHVVSVHIHIHQFIFTPCHPPSRPCFYFMSIWVWCKGKGQREGEDFFPFSRKTWNKFFWSMNMKCLYYLVNFTQIILFPEIFKP
jgi:hypothetical protein